VAFYMDSHEVTVEQYLRFCVLDGRESPESLARLGPTMPAEVTWEEAKAYASYYGKRLPTAAEFERANRGGATGVPYPWGDGLVPGEGFANIAGEEMSELDIVPGHVAGYRDRHTGPAPTASYRPNPLGIYDLCGNVWEWTCELVQPTEPPVQVAGGWPGVSGNEVRRPIYTVGGSWRSDLEQLTCSFKGMWPEDSPAGFRCVTSATAVDSDD
jgi:formylglycine-generating enzyme required for sulfatase activity